MKKQMKKALKLAALMVLALSLVGCGKGKLNEEEIKSAIVGTGIEIGDRMLAVKVPIDEVTYINILERKTDKKNDVDTMKVNFKGYSGEVTVDTTLNLYFNYEIESWVLSTPKVPEDAVKVSIDKDLSKNITTKYKENNENLEKVGILSQEYNVDEDGTAKVNALITGNFNNSAGTYTHEVEIYVTPQLNVSFYGAGISASYDVEEVSPVEILMSEDMASLKNKLMEELNKQTEIKFPNQFWEYYPITDNEDGNKLVVNELGDPVITANSNYGMNYDDMYLSLVAPIDLTIIANADPTLTASFNGQVKFSYEASKGGWKYSILSDK